MNNKERTIFKHLNGAISHLMVKGWQKIGNFAQVTETRREIRQHGAVEV